jgi:hypothetical protein
MSESPTGPALGAFAALVLVLVGVPALLLLLVGIPVPTSDQDWLTELSPNAWLRLATVPVWLLWLHLVVCVVVEVVADRRGSGLAVPVPGGGIGTQPFARWGIDGLALLRPAATPLEARVRRPATPAVPDLAEAAPPATASTPTAGRTPAADESTPTAGRPVTYYEVRPPEGRNYETLWDIADRFLGSGSRFREIVELNRGVTQPDGSTLRGADLVRRGWILRLPEDAEGRGLRVGDGLPAVDTAADAPAPTAAEAAVPDPDEPAEETGPLGVAAGLLAAELLASLLEQRIGRTGLALPAASPDAATEAVLRRAADPEAAELLTTSLAALGVVLSEAGEVPALRRCLVDDRRLVLGFAAPVPAAPVSPWQVSDGGATWSVPREDVRRLPRVETDRSALAPVVVTLGRQSDGVLRLLDLAAAGIASVSGDDPAARDAVLSWAVEAAVRQRDGRLDVWLVGFAQLSDAVAPRALHTVDTLDGVLDRLERHADEQRAACARRQVGSVAAGRLVDPGSTDWDGALVVLSGLPDDDSLRRLRLLVERPDADVSVVVVGDCQEASERFAITADGRLWNGPLGVDVRAQRLGAVVHEQVSALFASEPGRHVPATEVDLSAVAPTVQPDASAFQAQHPYAVEVGVLGPVAVDAHGPIVEERRPLLTELVVLLALRPGGVHIDELESTLWSQPPGAAERDLVLGDASRWLGETDDGRPRLTVDDGVARLLREGVRVDLDVFAAWVAAADEPGADRVACLRSALEVVRGRPFGQLRPHGYAWLADDAADVAATTAVVLVSRRLATTCASRGDGRGARDAVLAGLAVAPAAEDLWIDALRLADSLGGRRDVQAVADEMHAALARRASTPDPSAATRAVLDELLQGRRSR